MKAIAIDAHGDVYVADAGNKRIQVFDADGTFKREFGNVGTPLAMCMTRGATQYLYVSHAGDTDGMDDAAIYKVRLDGKVVGKFGSAGKLPKEFGLANSIDCRNENELLVGEMTNWRVQKVTLKGGAADPLITGAPHGAPQQFVRGWTAGYFTCRPPSTRMVSPVTKSLVDEERDRLGDFGLAAPAAQRRGPLDRGVLVGGRARRRHDRPGRDGVHEDLVGGQLEGQRLGQRLDAGLGHVVGEEARIARPAAGRDPVGEVHDPAAARLAHVRHRRPAAQERGPQIDRQLAVPVVFVLVVERHRACRARPCSPGCRAGRRPPRLR